MAAQSRRRALLKLALLAGILAAALLLAARLGWLEGARTPELVAGVRELSDRRGAAPLFVLIYAAATVLAFPGLALTLAGGAVFGFWLGLLLNWTGAMLGSVGAFLIARTLGRDAVLALLGRHAEKADGVAREHGFLGVLRLRLIPLVPFVALNYGAALAGVRLRDYLLATGLGILPAAAVYTYFADALVEGAAGARGDALVRVLVAGALLIMLSFVPALARRLGLAGAARRDKRNGVVIGN